jgi:hypothetical protein
MVNLVGMVGRVKKSYEDASVVFFEASRGCYERA